MKHQHVLMSLICVTLSLWMVSSLVRGQSLKTKGIWMHGASLPSNYQDNINLTSKLSGNNVKDVFLLTKGTAGSQTSDVKINNFIEAAHSNKIKVHLWYVVSQDDLYLKNNPGAHVYHSPKPDISTRPYRMTNEMVNLHYPGYKAYVMNKIKYFVTQFNCDGIHLDYIRYSHLVYSFDTYSLKKAASLGCDTVRLLSLFNTEPNYTRYAVNDGFINLYKENDTDVRKWVEMRKNTINDYIKSVKDTLMRYKPALKLSAAYMPETSTSPDYADVHYGQNLAMHSENLDIISPMAYFKSYGKTTSWLRTVATESKNKVNSNCEVSVGIQAFDNVTPIEIGEQMDYATAGGSDGLIIFVYSTITTDEAWNVIKNKFNTLTQNNETEEVKKVNVTTSGSDIQVSLQLAKPAYITIDIYSSTGERVLNKRCAMEAGSTMVKFSSASLNEGVYFCHLGTYDSFVTKKIIIKGGR